MHRQKTKIDHLVEQAVSSVAKRTTSYFRKSIIVNEVMLNKHVSKLIADVRRQFKPWKLDQIIIRDIEHRIGLALQLRDANGIRVYECYAAGERERRWLLLRSMTVDNLRAVMQQTRTQARQMTLKGEGYHILLEELEKIGKADATVDEVYETAVEKIRAHRAA